MENKSLSNLFISATGQILFVVVALNLLSLIFELTQLDNFDNYSLTFKHGYFILNGEQIGVNLFANIFAVIILAVILTISLSKKQKMKTQRN